jgi:hypothetical protein
MAKSTDNINQQCVKAKDNMQHIKLNNQYNKSLSIYNNLIWENMETADDTMINFLHSKIHDSYHKKIHILYNFINSTEKMPIESYKDVIKFYNIISPLNNEFNFSSFNWNHEIINKKLYIQNSLLKANLNDLVKSSFLNPIKNILKISGLNFKYYEFKSRRYNHNVDIVFVFDFQ